MKYLTTITFLLVSALASFGADGERAPAKAFAPKCPQPHKVLDYGWAYIQYSEKHKLPLCATYLVDIKKKRGMQLIDRGDFVQNPNYKMPDVREEQVGEGKTKYYPLSLLPAQLKTVYPEGWEAIEHLTSTIPWPSEESFIADMSKVTDPQYYRYALIYAGPILPDKPKKTKSGVSIPVGYFFIMFLTPNGTNGGLDPNIPMSFAFGYGIKPTDKIFSHVNLKGYESGEWKLASGGGAISIGSIHKLTNLEFLPYVPKKDQKRIPRCGGTDPDPAFLKRLEEAKLLP